MIGESFRELYWQTPPEHRPALMICIFTTFFILVALARWIDRREYERLYGRRK